MMTFDEKPTPTPPTEQPVSVHDRYDNSSLSIITALLGIFLVLETVALGYLITAYAGARQFKEGLGEGRQQLAEQVQERKDEIMATQPPLVYSVVHYDYDKGFNQKTGLYLVSRSTGQENLIYTPSGGYISLYAVPQVGYDGRVFFHETCGQCDDPYLHLFQLDISKNSEPEKVAFNDLLSFPDAAVVSPDQTMMAIAKYDDLGEGHAGHIYAANLLTGETQELGALADDEYFSRYFGENTLGYANQFTIRWRNRQCFEVNIYKDGEEKLPFGEKSYMEQRTYCAK